MKLSRKISALFILSSLFGLSPAASAGNGNFHAAVFVGATSADSKTYATGGGDLEYKINEMFGVGVIIDALLEHHGQTIVAGGLFLHPTEHIKVLAAVGSEFSHGTSQTVTRVGAGYDWHLQNGMSLGPVVNADFVNNHTSYVYGLSAGFSF